MFEIFRKFILNVSRYNYITIKLKDYIKILKLGLTFNVKDFRPSTFELIITKKKYNPNDKTDNLYKNI